MKRLAALAWLAGVALAIGPQAPMPAATPVLRDIGVARAAGAAVQTALPDPGSYAIAFKGVAVSFDLSGLEPDFDPIYKLIVSGTIHDTRPASEALPDATLVLLAYLEVFQPDTTPILPDLLHPNTVATSLAGFLSGKAELINRGGHVAYQGSMLAEVFQNNIEHLVIDLSPEGSGPTVRLEGPITLVKGGAEKGTLRALSPLARAALAVPSGHIPTWQEAVNGMSVHKPVMMGTAGSGKPGKPANPTTIAPAGLTGSLPSQSCDVLCRLRRPATAVPAGLGVAMVLLGMVLGMRRLRRVTPGALPIAPAGITRAADEPAEHETEA